MRGFTLYGVPIEDLGDRLRPIARSTHVPTDPNPVTLPLPSPPSIVLTLVLTAVAFKLLLAEKLPDLPYLTFLDKCPLVG